MSEMNKLFERNSHNQRWTWRYWPRYCFEFAKYGANIALCDVRPAKEGREFLENRTGNIKLFGL